MRTGQIIPGGFATISAMAKRYHKKNKGLSACVGILPGVWGFELLLQGRTLLLFGKGVLKQKGGKVSYDGACFFEGLIEGTYWSGSNPHEGFNFEGNFKGPLRDRFEGTVTFHSDNARYVLQGFKTRYFNSTNLK